MSDETNREQHEFVGFPRKANKLCTGWSPLWTTHIHFLSSSTYQLCLFTSFPADNHHLYVRVTSLSQPLTVPLLHAFHFWEIIDRRIHIYMSFGHVAAHSYIECSAWMHVCSLGMNNTCKSRTCWIQSVVPSFFPIISVGECQGAEKCFHRVMCGGCGTQACSSYYNTLLLSPWCCRWGRGWGG